MDGHENPRLQRRFRGRRPARSLHRIHAKYRDTQRVAGDRLYLRRYTRPCGRHIEAKASAEYLPRACHAERRREDARTIAYRLVTLTSIYHITSASDADQAMKSGD